MEKLTKEEQELEDYLKSIGGLKNGWFTNKEPITSRYFFSIGKGWIKSVIQLIKDCTAKEWNKEILQVKEKFGGLRFYINGASEEVHDLIHKAEQESYKICEKCGNPGKLEKIQGWYSTLCTNCLKEKDENSNNT